jgi:hypothetical protein
MMNIKQIILAFGLLMLSLASFGQSSPCVTELGRVMDQYRKAQEGQGSYAIAVDIHAVPKDSMNLGTVDRTFELAAMGNRMRYLSKEMSVFADDRYVANVLHEEKTIYLSAAPKEGFRTPAVEAGGGVMEKELLKQARLLSCEPVRQQGCSSCKLLTMEVTGGSLQQRGIATVRYLYDPATLELKETRIDYVPGMEDAYVVLRYRKARQQWAPSLDTPVQTILFSKGETLLPAFSGYNLIKTSQQ